MDLMQKSPKVLTEVLKKSRKDLLMNQNDPTFLHHVLKILDSDLKRVIELTGRLGTKENIFHILASGSHFESCQLLVDTIEDAVVARLMLERSSLTMKSPLILALSSKTEVFAMGSQESEKVMKPHPQTLVATLFWKTCEKAVLNNPSLTESLKVHKFFTYPQASINKEQVSNFNLLGQAV